MKLYKYTPHIDDFIENCTLKLTPSFQLNDPFELKVTRSFISKAAEEFENSPQLKQIRTTTIRDNILSALEESWMYIGVLSLSRKWDDLKMWGHYTNNFKGGVIEFDISITQDQMQKETATCDLFTDFQVMAMRNIIYSSRRPIFNSFHQIQKTLNRAYFKKPLQWKHEDEFRIIGHPTKSNLFKMSNEVYSRYFEADIREKSSQFNVSKKNKDHVWITHDHTHKTLLAHGKLKKLIANEMNFHPLISVDPARVTGIYFGMSHDTTKLDKKELEKFRNLNDRLLKIMPHHDLYTFRTENINLR